MHCALSRVMGGRRPASAETEVLVWCDTDVELLVPFDAPWFDFVLSHDVAYVVTLRESNSHSSHPSRPAHRPTRMED